MHLPADTATGVLTAAHDAFITGLHVLGPMGAAIFVAWRCSSRRPSGQQPLQRRLGEARAGVAAGFNPARVGLDAPVKMPVVAACCTPAQWPAPTPPSSTAPTAAPRRPRHGRARGRRRNAHPEVAERAAARHARRRRTRRRRRVIDDVDDDAAANGDVPERALSEAHHHGPRHAPTTPLVRKRGSGCLIG
jgi:hypothetical protein